MGDAASRLLLLTSVFVIATCGLIYELTAGTLASYLLGDSVTQFSTIIGVYLFAMGVGSFLSRYAKRHLVARFIEIEFLIGAVGGSSAAILFLAFPLIDAFRPLLYGLVFLIGTLVGIEIPLLLRILKDRLEFSDLVSRVFSFDYVGALLAALLFPLVLVPHLGLVRSSFLFGILNTLVGLLAVHVLRRELLHPRLLAVTGVVVLAGLIAGFASSNRLLAWSEQAAYVDPVIYAKSTAYQRIVLTRSGNDLRLYLNSNLQFSSRDEYRYHESLVHPGLSRVAATNVLILGGGDGLAAREVLRHTNVAQVTLVDLDPDMTRLFSEDPLLTPLNDGALNSPRVTVVNADAFSWMDTNTNRFDFVIIDFPDPSNFSLGKLYTTTFYHRLKRHLAPGAAVAVQCTSPLIARQAFWCVDTTLRDCGFLTQPYHAYVPSFGEWGFILASREPLPETLRLPPGLRFVTEDSLPDLFRFPPDMARLPTEVNRLNNQRLVQYFEAEWTHYVH
jgi:spermidine synthase